MTDKGVSNSNPKIDPAPNSNTEKEPDDWVSGSDPMTGAQVSYLKTISEECDEPESFQADLTKAEASKRIDALKQRCATVSVMSRAFVKETDAGGRENFLTDRYRPIAIS